jgi:hypothetical protein
VPDATPASGFLPWGASGSYLESCNCDAICPCRRIDGVAGGRSTHGICEGALSWLIEDGRAGDTDLSGLAVVLAARYDDDEEGSPWSFVLYVDERGDQRQREALTEIFLGRLGGTPNDNFPWVWKASDVLAVRAVPIEIDHTPGRGWFRAREAVSVRMAGPFEGSETVTCVIPGHDRSGRELNAERLTVDDPPLASEWSGVCAFESSFAYASADSAG